MDRLRVLVADDEAGMRHSIARALERFRVQLPEVDGEVGFEVIGVPSGEEALAAIGAHPVDLLLLDYKMEGMSGLDVLETLREQPDEPLIVMITAFATIETAVRATKSGAFDFIAKPFTPDELKETVRKAASHLIVQRQARKLAEEKRRVRFQFISVLGHELKSPLGAVESFLSVLRDHVAGDDLSEYDNIIDRCRARVEGMRKLISDLLDLTRIESGQKKRELTEVDVAASARMVIDNLEFNAEQRQVTVELAVEGPTVLSADSGEVEIILNNLVSNAIKYNREGGSVDVRLEGDEDSLQLIVRDTGIGLAEEEAERLFNDFVRIKNDKTRHIPGSGLGLSIVKKIAQLYDGDVRVESKPDEGSTFTVELRRRTCALRDEHEAPRDTGLVAGN